VVLDLVDFRVLAALQVGRLPSQVLTAQAGRIAFVNCLGTGNIVGIDLRRLAVVGRFEAGGSPASGPVQFTLTKAGFPVWTANRNAGSASNALSATRINHIPLDFQPGAVASDEAGQRAFLAGPESDRLAYVQAEAGEAKFARLLAPGGGYKSVAATRNGNLVAVVHPLKEAASFHRGPDLLPRSVLSGLRAPARVLATDDDTWFCILDPRGNTVSLVDIASLA
jgi:DNA-binding beta-propeller fold protein YncE